MQHVLKCWERQSDGPEYKKTLRRPSLSPGPCWGSLQHFRKPPSWWGGWLSPPQEPHPPALGLSGLAVPTPTPKLVPTPLVVIYRVGRKVSHTAKDSVEIPGKHTMAQFQYWRARVQETSASWASWLLWRDLLWYTREFCTRCKGSTVDCGMSTTA